MRTVTMRRIGAAVLVVATVSIATAVSMSAAPSVSADQLPECPDPGEYPAPNPGGPAFTDNNVAIYAGEDFVATGTSAESEGVTVVVGNASFDTPGRYNVGTVGVGSGIAPAGGSDMLLVGGNVAVAGGTTLDVGAGADGGGNAKVGGTATGTIETNGGALTTGLGAAAALVPYNGFGQTTLDASAEMAMSPTTGTAERSGARLDFIGGGAAVPQVFNVAAADLDGVTEFYFTQIPPDAAVLINVTGPGAVSVNPTYTAINGVRVDDFGAADNGFGKAAAALMWNFVDTTSLSIDGGGQFMGTVLMPTPGADLTTTASTNGRLYVGGTITTQGQGNEHHNYPWRPPFGCIDSVGSFAVHKAIDGDGADQVPAGTVFTVTYTYPPTGAGQLDVPADGTVVFGPVLPAGTVVTFDEPQLPNIPGIDWGTPVITVDGQVTNQLIVGDGTSAEIVVTNQAGVPTTPATTVTTTTTETTTTTVTAPTTLTTTMTTTVPTTTTLTTGSTETTTATVPTTLTTTATTTATTTVPTTTTLTTGSTETTTTTATVPTTTTLTTGSTETTTATVPTTTTGTETTTTTATVPTTTTLTRTTETDPATRTTITTLTVTTTQTQTVPATVTTVTTTGGTGSESSTTSSEADPTTTHSGHSSYTSHSNYSSYSSRPVPTTSGSLSDTGVDVGRGLAIGGALLAAGGVFLLTARRRPGNHRP